MPLRWRLLRYQAIWRAHQQSGLRLVMRLVISVYENKNSALPSIGSQPIPCKVAVPKMPCTAVSAAQHQQFGDLLYTSIKGNNVLCCTHCMPTDLLSQPTYRHERCVSWHWSGNRCFSFSIQERISTPSMHCSITIPAQVVLTCKKGA